MRTPSMATRRSRWRLGLQHPMETSQPSPFTGGLSTMAGWRAMVRSGASSSRLSYMGASTEPALSAYAIRHLAINSTGPCICSAVHESAGPCRSPRQRTSASGQPYRELGEVADFAIDRERAAVLLGYDLVAHRQAKSRTFAVRFGCEERLEQF